MLEISHQFGIIVFINGIALSVVIRNRNNELYLALWSFVMGLVCYNMSWIDGRNWMKSQYLILGICVPFIIYIGSSVIFLYLKVVRKLRLLHKLKVMSTHIARNKKQS